VSETLSIRQLGLEVVLLHEGRPLLRLPWRAADEFADALRDASRAASVWANTGVALFAERTVRLGAGALELTVRQKEAGVLVVGTAVMDVTAELARDISHALRSVARKCEEVEKAENIIADGALLFRSGAPFGFSDHPKIQEEIVKTARDDRDLRRFMPGGIKSTEVLGTPTLTQGPAPATLESALRIAGRMSPEERRRFAAAHGGN
jgi:hypothetical protein